MTETGPVGDEPDDADPDDSGRRRHPWLAGLGGLVTGLLLGVVLSVVTAVIAFMAVGGVAANDWDCPHGYYYATKVHGGHGPDSGVDCIKYGKHVPKGWRAAPRGNQKP